MGVVQQLSQNTFKALSEAALEAREQAYAPYSNFYVGAALITENGDIYKGCNIENASYGLTNCAERTAVFTAIAETKSKIQAMVLVLKGGGTPCGACRQVLNEFNPQMLIYCIDVDGELKYQTTLEELLPKAFGPHSLDV